MVSINMKIRGNIVLFVVTAALLCACSSRHVEAIYHAGDENPPEFLAGPVAMVLTNFGGFSAHVVFTITPADGPAHSISGEVLGREGKLIFQPTPVVKGKRAREEGSLFFIWDESRHSGYVLSEALQSYAPTRTTVEAATPFAITKGGIQEEINGHICHRYDAVADLLDGRRERLTLWRSDEAGHLPVRLEAVKGLQLMTLNFSEVRMEFPPTDIFLPPEGFTPYGSAVAMINELIVRDARYAKSHSTGEFQDPSDVRSTSWHDSQPGMPYAQ
jgi:hypothetical protein